MKVLVCPLNWGLGHATRCVPLVRRLLADGHEVVLVSDGFPLEFLRQQFPELRFIELPSYSIRYSAGKTQVLAMLWNLPGVIYGIYKEHKWLKNLLQREHFDQVISDNRFGLWNRKIKSIYMTHQLMIKMPFALKWLEPLAWLLHRLLILQYDECWIP
jgi:UDP:flavonoid glycosyltransferase YjiC (YdhE family)